MLSSARRPQSLASSTGISAHGTGPPPTLPQLVQWEADKFKDFVFRRCHRMRLAGTAAATSSSSLLLDASNIDAVDPPEVPRSFLRAVLLARYGPGSRLTPDGVALPAPTTSQHNTTAASISTTAAAAAAHSSSAAAAAASIPTLAGGGAASSSTPPEQSATSSPSAPLQLRSTVRIQTPSRISSASPWRNNGDSVNAGGRRAASAKQQQQQQQQQQHHSSMKPPLSLPPMATAHTAKSSSSVSSLHHSAPLGTTHAAASASSFSSSAAVAPPPPPPKVVLLSNRDKKPLQFFEMQMLMQGEWRDFITDVYSQRPAELGGARDRGEAAHQLPDAVVGELDRSKNALFFLGMDITPHELDVVLSRAVRRAKRTFEKETEIARQRAAEDQRLLGLKAERDQKLQEQRDAAKKLLEDAQQHPGDGKRGGGRNAPSPPQHSKRLTAAQKKQQAAAAAAEAEAAAAAAEQQAAALSSGREGGGAGGGGFNNASAYAGSSAGGTAASSRRKHLRKMQAAHMRAFNFVSDAIFEEKDRRVRELRKTVPASTDIRPDDDKANGVEKSKKFYGHKTAKPYGKIRSYDDPRDVQRSLHRHAFEVINDLAERGNIAESMLNLRCLRDDYMGAPDGRPGWDDYASLRYKLKTRGRM